jgi:hypothetical protein
VHYRGGGSTIRVMVPAARRTQKAGNPGSHDLRFASASDVAGDLADDACMLVCAPNLGVCLHDIRLDGTSAAHRRLSVLLGRMRG